MARRRAWHARAAVVERCDVIVVGAGPAGAAAALAARRARPEARVVLLDRADFPRDKACGDGVPGGCDAELAALGAGDLLADWPRVERLRIETPSGAFADGPPQPAPRVVPRYELDARLVAAATRAGAELRRHRVGDVAQTDDAAVVDDELAAPVLVAADGARSAVRRRLGLAPNSPRWTGVAIRAYAPAPTDAQLVRLLVERWPAYAWSFPIGDGTANVGIGAVAERLDGGRGLLERWLRGVLPEADFDEASVRGCPLPLWVERPRLAHGRVLLAGDAASLVNPLSGEGILTALRSGRLAGEAAVDPERAGRRYRRAMGAQLGRHLRHTGTLARLAGDFRLVEATVDVCGRDGARFDQLAGITMDDGRLRASTLAAVARRRAAALRGR